MDQTPRTVDPTSFDPVSIAAMKATTSISVCIPAKNEARTVGHVVEVVRRSSLAGERPGASANALVDELVVIDDDSSDATAEVARGAGATVVPGEGRGKGHAMRVGLESTTGDVVVFLDADVEDTHEDFVPRLVGPLLADAGTVLVKGSYRRPYGNAPTGGGRVTELMARPLLEVWFPELAVIGQPLAGETALRRTALEHIELTGDYGVEIGLLIDVAARFGPDAIAQVDLGVRTHRNRSLDELRPQAVDILLAVVNRLGATRFTNPLIRAQGRGPR